HPTTPPHPHPLSLHDALPISIRRIVRQPRRQRQFSGFGGSAALTLFASCRQRKRQTAHCCGQSKEWHETFPRPPDPWSTQSFEPWAVAAFATARREARTVPLV